MHRRNGEHSSRNARCGDDRWPLLVGGALALLLALAVVLLGSAWWQYRQGNDLRNHQLVTASWHWAGEIAAARTRQRVALEHLTSRKLFAELIRAPDSEQQRNDLSRLIGVQFAGACGWFLEDSSGSRLAETRFGGAQNLFCDRQQVASGYSLTASIRTAGASEPRVRIELDAAALLEPLVTRSPSLVHAYLARREPGGFDLVGAWPVVLDEATARSRLTGAGLLAVPVSGTPWELLLETEVPGAMGLPAWWLPGSGLLILGLAGVACVAVYRGALESASRRAAQQQAGEYGQRLQAILDNSNALVCIKDRDGRYLLANCAFEEYLGLPAAQIVGRSDEELFAAASADALRRGDQHFWQQQTAWCSEEALSAQGLEGLFRWVRFPILGADGSVVALGCFATDVSADRRMEVALRDSESRYRAIFDQASDGILLVDPDSGALVDFNDSAHEFLGYTAAEFDGLRVSDLERPAESEETLLDGYSGSAVGGRWSYETRYSTRSGELRQVLVNANTVSILGQRQVLLFVRDISEQKRIELSLSMLSSALDQSGSVVVITDRRDRIEYVNRRFTEVAGYSPEEVLGRPSKVLRSPETPEGLVEEIRAAGSEGREWRGELLNRRKSGERYWALISISPVKNDRDEVTHFVTVGDDVTEIKETQFQMERLAFYDTLTGLANRQLFRERLEQALRVADRTQRSAALLYLDLDRFKRVNDTLGHDAGDALLNAVGERLAKCVRKEDSVARLGGDEFTVLLAEVDGPSGAAVVARKILDTLSESVHVASQEVFVSASIGITMIPQDGVDSAVLLKNADLAMYRAKDQGRNNYQFFRKEMNDQAAERLTLENDLRRAMYRGELVLHYQPVVVVVAEADRRVVALEALLRWHHPDRGLVGPDVFIAVAEESGLLVPMGQWVLRTACSQVKTLQGAGHPELGVCVNLSARQFRDPNLVGSVEATLMGTGLEPRHLQLEITETLLMENLEDAIGTVWQLKDLGVAVSIDDFGAGYSSLGYLKRLPVDHLKVDRSFVSDIPDDSDAMAITAAVIAMAHKLQLTVVAEGVETEAQLEFLRENRCDFFQGHLFSEPLPGEEIQRILDPDTAAAPKG